MGTASEVAVKERVDARIAKMKAEGKEKGWRQAELDAMGAEVYECEKESN